MGRLTKINEDACQLCKADYCIEKEPCFLYEVYDKLAHYEDLEEQGRLIEQKHGQWNYNKYKQMYCSNCGEYPEIAVEWNYCPNCGAKMDLKELKGE